MKLSSKTGLKKKFDMEVSEAIFEDFGHEESVIRIGKKHFDLDDDQYAIQKVVVPVHQRREINRLDGHKIFVSEAGVRDDAMSDGEIGNRPTVISGGGDRSFVSAWEISDFDHSDEPHYRSGSGETFQSDAADDLSDNEDVHSLKEAKGLSKEIIDNANNEAKRIIEAAQMEATEIRNTAHQEGYQSGFAQVNTEIEVLRKIQVEMNKTKEEILQNTEPEIIELIRMIAEKLFTDGMVLDANVLKNIVGRAINEASRIGNLKVYLNPGDLDKLKKLWRESELEFNGQKIQLASNNDVLPGGVYVEGDYGSVDGRIATQLDSVLEKINDIRMEEQEVL